MGIRQRVATGFMCTLYLGVLLAVMIIPAQAWDGSRGKDFHSRGVPPGVPQVGRPLYSPPVFMDRSTPISERPLAPIGGGTQVAPGSVPFVWCQGQWVRIDSPWHSCSSR
jgi:hypothetical protein